MTQDSNSTQTSFPWKTFLLIFVPVILLMAALLTVTIWSMMNPPGEIPKSTVEQSAPNL